MEIECTAGDQKDAREYVLEVALERARAQRIGLIVGVIVLSLTYVVRIVAFLPPPSSYDVARSFAPCLRSVRCYRAFLRKRAYLRQMALSRWSRTCHSVTTSKTRLNNQQSA